MVVRYFGPGRESQWLRLVRVLAYSAQGTIKDWEHDIVSVEPDESIQSPLGRPGNVWNTQKLDLWANECDHAADGARLLFLDADTAIVRPLDDIWDRDFDVAYTVKPKASRYPLNGGVLFVRNSERVCTFMAAWRVLNRFFLTNPGEYGVWGPAFGGINQAALGVLLEKRSHPEAQRVLRLLGIDHACDGLQVVKLPCLEWNCEDDHWAAYEPARTRIVHFKSQLQMAIFEKGVTPDGAKPLKDLWRGLEKSAMRHLPDVPVGPERTTQVLPSELETPEPEIEHPETPPKLTRRQRRQLQRSAAGVL